MPTIALLIISNVFMTFAWYGHLKSPDPRLWAAILIAWGIAFAEYCFAVPANRIGYASGWSGGQLKIVQEVISLTVFFGFMVWILKEPLTFRHVGAFVCLMGATLFMFAGRPVHP